ncbi:exodeoxyribonuclease III [Brevibacterium jeotgali]|uniref:Exodeoxyribonuclease-3 n=1 Tax=Brevibacterium jeotgali TaxID=1262550 RepID=A0A2H1L7T5_9MICO|nr:exodeoxyribonuclease III [Brevibacterium jeotgali]TWC03280.1 exodeoxyribonuclease-3 [Brevibacterium jeotgali]SMY12939.1 exodeoxyribonuclease-3 [Brevibacterium jeotgali]
MLRIATANINGIRATRRRGFGEWMATRGCDVVALQEVRAQAEKIPAGAFGDFHAALDTGSLPGRSGVAVLTRHPAEAVRTWGATALVRAPGDAHVEPVAAPDHVPRARGLARFADEGRYVEVDLADVPLTVASLYLPKGGLPAELQRPERMRGAPDGGARYERKMGFMSAFSRYLTRTRRAAAAAGREFLLMGDLNIAQTHHDVAAWRRSRQADGFLPEERDWIGRQLSPRTLVDVVRSLHPGEEGPYSWWSWAGQSFAKDAGWRIDYHLATPRLARAAVRAEVDREFRGERLSDHSPVVVDYDRW